MTTAPRRVPGRASATPTPAPSSAQSPAAPAAHGPGEHYTRCEQVASDLTHRITRGELTEGERLPSEPALAEHYGVSRGTIRRALALLADSRLVRTRPGAGSYVAFHGSSLTLPRARTAAQPRTSGSTTAEVVSTELLDTPDDLAALTSEPRCWRITQRRLLDGEPVAVEVSLIPANERMSTVMDFGLLGGSVSVTLRATGMVTARGEQDIAVRPLPSHLSDVMGVASGTAVLMTRMTGLSDDGELTESVTCWLRPEHVSLHLGFGEGSEPQGDPA